MIYLTNAIFKFEIQVLLANLTRGKRFRWWSGWWLWWARWPWCLVQNGALVQYTIGAIGAMCNCNWAFAFDDDKDDKNNDDDVEQPIIFTFQCLKPTVQGIFTRLVSWRWKHLHPSHHHPHPQHHRNRDHNHHGHIQNLTSELSDLDRLSTTSAMSESSASHRSELLSNILKYFEDRNIWIFSSSHTGGIISNILNTVIFENLTFLHFPCPRGLNTLDFWTFCYFTVFHPI